MIRIRRIVVAIAAAVGLVAIPTSIQSASAQTTRDAFLWPFASNSPWNMPMGDGALYEAANAPATANLIDSQYGMSLNAERWSQPVYKAASTDPTVTMTDTVKNRVFTFQAVPGSQPAQPPVSQGGDANWHMVQPDGHTIFENWHAQWTSATTLTSGYTRQGDLWGDGLSGTRAYGGSAIGGLIRKDEITNRNIPHAIAFGLTGTQLKSGFVWPAKSQDWNGSTTYSGQVPMGSLFAIPPSVDLNTLGLNPDGLALARALQLYGGYATARGANDSVSAEPGSDATRVTAMRNQVALIKSQLRLVTNNSQANPGGPGNRLAPLAPAITGAP